MKFAFIVSYLGTNKWFAPLIAEALSQNIPTEIWLDYRDISKTTKWYEFPAQDKMPRHSKGANLIYKHFESQQQLVRLVQDSDATFLFANRVPVCEIPKHQKWIHIVNSYYDTLVGTGAKELNRFQFLLFNTSHWIEAGKKYYRWIKQLQPDSEFEKTFTEKWIPTGTPQFDHFLLCEKDQIRKKLGIPLDKKVVTVYAFESVSSYWCQRIFYVHNKLKRLLYWLILPFSYPHMTSKIGRRYFFTFLINSLKNRFDLLKQCFTAPSEKDILQAVRNFCDKNDYFLVLKARLKNPLKSYHSDIADLVIDKDSDYFPYTSAQVISASDLIITFYSSCVGEAVFAGVPVLNMVPPKHKYFAGGEHYLPFHLDYPVERSISEGEIFYNNKPDGFYEFKGVVVSWTPKQIIANLPQNSLDHFVLDKTAQNQFVKKYIKAEEQPAAKSIIYKLKSIQNHK